MAQAIDGSLTFDTDDHIVEAKWRQEAIQPHHLYSFNSLGIFISVNGFTSGAREAYRESTPFLTVEGLDFFYVLDGRLTLDELLRRKKRHANETGSCYFPATMFPGE
ncbi:hypothetical protein [Streptomyces olivaceoviridis]|uniref:hypothetical protein n=1 Tax=Streptomyces olivaceoviridis TaxID=1921 RepID=UPI003702FC15